MIVSEKKLRELERRLSNKNEEIVIETISSLRDEGPFYGAIRLLAKVYNNSGSEVIKGLVRDFMNDLKERDAVVEVMDEIKKTHNPDTLSMLVSSCWQSGLDYSPYAREFANLFTRENFQVALECFTVIEESVPHLSKNIRMEIISIIEAERDSYSHEKSALMTELISILE